MRIVATFTIYGDHDVLSHLSDMHRGIDITLRQIGLSRKIAASDEWCLKTPYFNINIHEFSNQVSIYCDYLEDIFNFKLINSKNIEKSVMYIMPISKIMSDEVFHGALDRSTISKLNRIGCSLEISPESIMPECRNLLE